MLWHHDVAWAQFSSSMPLHKWMGTNGQGTQNWASRDWNSTTACWSSTKVLKLFAETLWQRNMVLSLGIWPLVHREIIPFISFICRKQYNFISGCHWTEEWRHSLKNPRDAQSCILFCFCTDIHLSTYYTAVFRKYDAVNNFSLIWNLGSMSSHLLTSQPPW